MKKFYVILIALLTAGGSYAQCVIDTANLSIPGMLPNAQHLHHIVRDSLYDQTIQVHIPDTMSMNFGGFVNVSIRIDSVRLDSLNGVPNGIAWSANPTVLRGGHYGCGQITGTTSDTAGTYPVTPIGMAWAHLTIPILGVDIDTFQYGPLDRFPGFMNFYVVVDSVQLPLSVTTTVINLCDATPNGSINAHPSGGSTVVPYTYLWSTGSTYYTINNLAAGTYMLTVTSGFETVTTSVDVITDPAITLTHTVDSSTNGTDGGAVVIATGGTPPYTYFWNGGLGTDDSITGVDAGSYRVTVRDSLGCIARDTAIVPGVILNGILTVGNEIPKLNLFPNPAHNLVTVSVEAAGSFNGKMEMADITGRIVYSTPVSVNAGRYNRAVNVEQFSPGIYILQLTSQNRSVQQKFVVNH